MYFNAMFDEVPVKKPYNKDPTGHKQIRDYHHMLEILNHTFTSAPQWTDAAAHVGMVGEWSKLKIDHLHYLTLT